MRIMKPLSYDKAMAGLKLVFPILIAVISYFFISDFVSSANFTQGFIESIEKSRDSVLRLAGSSTAVSVAISALPGDLATPIATEIAELSFGFMAVLCAIYLEKFLVVLSGMVVFKWLIPIACLASFFGQLLNKETLREVSKKIAIFALALFLIVPVSTKISDTIRDVYGETIDQTIESAENSAGLIKESIQGGEVTEDTGNGLGKVIENLKRSGDTIANGTSEFMKYLERLMTRFIESIAILVVTSCIIPIIVIIGIIWIVKLLFMPNSMINLSFLQNKIAKDKLNR